MQESVLVGEFSQDTKHSYTYASSFVHALSQLGHGVSQCNITKFSSTVLQNLYVVWRVWRERPDIVFLIKAHTIWARTLRFIKKRFGVRLVNFYPDSPFVLWNGNSTRHVLESLPLYDCFLIWSQQLVPILEQAGCKKVRYMPFGYDPRFFPEHIAISADDRKHYASEVCFIGTWEPEREKWLNQLVAKISHVQLAIWGNEWDKQLAVDSPLRPLLRGRAIYADERLRAFRLTKIVLNFIRRQNATSHNMRTMEVLASNAFLLTQRTYEQAEFLFQEGKHLACFDSVEECAQKICYYMEHEDRRQEIIRAGYEKVKQYTLERCLARHIKQLSGNEKNCNFNPASKQQRGSS